MTKCCCALLAILLPGTGTVLAQHTATQPVLSAPPAPLADQPGASLTSAASAATTRPASGLGADYVLAPEDSIQVTVWKEPSLSGNLPIRPDGMISLALLGDLPAAGFTPARLSSDIAVRLKKYVTDPRVTVTVMAVHVDKVFLLGEVGHVGALPLTPGMTPLQAISAAGGLTLYANGKRIYILRKEAGQQKRIPFNYKKALKDGDEQGVSLVAGDTIVVP